MSTPGRPSRGGGVSDRGVDVLVHDFAGHPFEAQLSRGLAARGLRVGHAYCGGVTTGQGDLARRTDDPVGLWFADASSEAFERYSPVGRLKSELRYGERLSALVRQARPRLVISANTPLLAQAKLWRTCRRIGAQRVFWLQDFLGRGVREILSDRHALLGATVGRAAERLETELLRRADGVIAISDDFVTELNRRGVVTRALVVENWAPLDEVVVGTKPNAWSTRHGLEGKRVAVYAGTLGLKHDPQHLVTAARALLGTSHELVVVSEGIGRDELEAVKRAGGLDQLRLFDFVPYEELGDLLATADVCLVLLEREAGMFSVPSKVLTYLAAGRSIVGAVPLENLAARTIERAGAGTVVRPGDHVGFGEAVRAHLDDSDRTAREGRAARAYAVETFDIDRIARRVAEFVADLR